MGGEGIGRTVSNRAIFAAVGVLAVLAGTAMWLITRPGRIEPEIGGAALYAATFTDARGAQQSLGKFQGKVIVLNFWATWCAPCREEMPAFERLQSRWASRGVQFVGLSDEEPARVERFAREIGVTYPLWTGGEAVGELARRLGNRTGVLPFTVLITADGQISDEKVGAYTESDLSRRLEKIRKK
jgi:thiol-disulfide isomerase/thioredoxin